MSTIGAGSSRALHAVGSSGGDFEEKKEENKNNMIPKAQHRFCTMV